MYRITIFNHKNQFESFAEFKTIEQCKAWYKGYIYNLNPLNNEKKYYNYIIVYITDRNTIQNKIIQLIKIYQDIKNKPNSKLRKELIIESIARNIDEYEEKYEELWIELLTENKNIINQIKQRRAQNAMAKTKNTTKQIIR